MSLWTVENGLHLLVNDNAPSSQFAESPGMRLAAYAGVGDLSAIMEQKLTWLQASLALAAGVILKALHQRANFYAACVYLSQSSANLMVGDEQQSDRESEVNPTDYV